MVLAGVVVVSSLGILAHGGSGPAAASTSLLPGSYAADAAAYLTYPNIPATAPCPVPSSLGARSAYPAALRRLAGKRPGSWQGSGSLWVLTPDLAIAAGQPNGSIVLHVPWFVTGPGRFRIVAHRIDGRAPDIDVPVAALRRGEPGRLRRITIVMPTLGCWDIAGIVGRHSLEWVAEPQLGRRRA